MTHKKLQKLCYYAYAWYYTLKNERLFRNNWEAWIHGPVDPLLYSEYKRYGWQLIPKKESSLDSELFDFVKEVYNSYGDLDGDELEYLTHQEDPWLEARGNTPSHLPCNNHIKDEVIREYYLKVYAEGQND